MPLINVNLAKTLNDQTKNELQKQLAQNISELPGKTKELLTVCITDGCTMYKDAEPFDGVFFDVRIYQQTTEQGKENFAKKVFKISESILGLPPQRTQMNFIELDCWAVGNVYKTVRK